MTPKTKEMDGTKMLPQSDIRFFAGVLREFGSFGLITAFLVWFFLRGYPAALAVQRDFASQINAMQAEHRQAWTASIKEYNAVMSDFQRAITNQTNVLSELRQSIENTNRQAVPR